MGRAELGAENYSATLRFNGARGAWASASCSSPAPTRSRWTRRCARSWSACRSASRPGCEYGVAFDTTTVGQRVDPGSVLTLLEAIVLVILIIFLFLQDWRSTLIPAVTIPVSLVGTFAFVKLFGFSINTLTLFGITLATGLVVDDAIVVIENVERHMGEERISAHAATSEAMGEVTGAVIATSLVLIAVFVPVGFFPGTTGRLYQQFSLTIAFSIALSAFNSLTFTPGAVCARCCGRRRSRRAGSSGGRGGPAAPDPRVLGLPASRPRAAARR